MKAPSVALVSLWAGQLDANSDVINMMAMHELTQEEQRIALSVLMRMENTCHALIKLIKESQEAA